MIDQIYFIKPSGNSVPWYFNPSLALALLEISLQGALLFKLYLLKSYA